MTPTGCAQNPPTNVEALKMHVSVSPFSGSVSRRVGTAHVFQSSLFLRFSCWMCDTAAQEAKCNVPVYRWRYKFYPAVVFLRCSLFSVSFAGGTFSKSSTRENRPIDVNQVNQSNSIVQPVTIGDEANSLTQKNLQHHFWPTSSSWSMSLLNYLRSDLKSEAQNSRHQWQLRLSR